MINYGFIKTVNKPFKDVLEKSKQELQKEGFGILSNIDVREKFKEKLNVNFNNYTILGACNPPFSYKSIQLEENVGLMLPCNVLVYEKEGKTVVSVIKPTIAMGMIGNKELKEVAEKIEEKLKRAFDSI